jgi:hypothetical protein
MTSNLTVYSIKSNEQMSSENLGRYVEISSCRKYNAMHKQENERERAIPSDRKADFGNLVSGTKRDGRETIMRGALWK